jgi:hypothetical protein
LNGGLGSDELYGGSGQDQFNADAGDKVFGGQGDDVAIIDAAFSDVSITTVGTKTVITFTDGSTVSIKGVEHIDFDDQTIDL